MRDRLRPLSTLLPALALALPLPQASCHDAAPTPAAESAAAHADELLARAAAPRG